ncbi:13933_t:CDS:2, partial [Funneliformis caledonium]
TAAYQNLIQILLYPKFEKEHLITNLQSLKKQHEQLPLMKIQSHVIPINTKNTPSTTKDSKRIYYFSLIEHLQRILKNPFLSSQLYFGPEGDLWAESPLFGQSNLITAQDFIQYYSPSKSVEIGRICSFIIVNERLAIHIQRLISYEQIPQYLHSKKHASHSLQG